MAQNLMASIHAYYSVCVLPVEINGRPFTSLLIFDELPYFYSITEQITPKSRQSLNYGRLLLFNLECYQVLIATKIDRAHNTIACWLLFIW